jgi:putative transposase
MLKIVETKHGDEAEREVSALDRLAREGARRMLEQALETEVESYIERHRDARDAKGHALVVRNGRSQARSVVVGAGVLGVRTPRVNDKRVVDGERQKFASEILPPYLRKSQSVSELLPALYLRGLSTGDFRGALAALLGDGAPGFSPSVVTRLVSAWQSEYDAWKKRPLTDRDYVYIWADGVHFNVRLEDDRLAALVIIGARADGTKEVIALEDGFRESTESWAALLRDLKARGMRAPVVAIGDGALGFWSALRDVFPTMREQRCWVHKIANVLDKLPKSQQPKAKSLLHEMMNAATKAECERLMATFATDYEAKYPKAVKSLQTEADKLTTHFDFPAEHWKHLRTTNPIESTFATVKLRQRVTKGAGSRKAGLAMAYRLLLLAEASWRRLNGHQLLPLVRAGVQFVDGVRVERAQLAPDVDTIKPQRKTKNQTQKVAA